MAILGGEAAVAAPGPAFSSTKGSAILLNAEQERLLAWRGDLIGKAVYVLHQYNPGSVGTEGKLGIQSKIIS